MNLLGRSLKDLRLMSPNPDSLTPGTWSRIGIQCLYVLKQLHDGAVVHGDVKPTNYVLGNPTDCLKSRIFYLIDFAIAQKFIVNTGNGFEYNTEKRKSKILCGTPR